MKIGYPCINRSIGCTPNRTFRLASYSKERLIETIEMNLESLEMMIEYNIERGLLFLRITSSIIPFASHPVCRYDWKRHFKAHLRSIGKMIKKAKMRISMHPDQFTLINSKDVHVYKRAVRELEYHADILDLMGLNRDAKIQIHVGGVYDDKLASMKRFIARYRKLSKKVRKRLVIENDERLYSLFDCLVISKAAKIPILFDSFHHSILNNDENYYDALKSVSKTWKRLDGLPMVDYSSQRPEGRVGAHTESIDLENFKKFLKSVDGIDFDLMLEIKDKEESALKALHLSRHLHLK
ncbi:MAG: UV DNA damage repair endonuclease UvsE [Deltaproteobacteria bacterium]|jgi:UV DNA damage endonuclease|nr:UV DNA damage repair endonuclease UvsE [Deltaproteobacteria bacterium]